MCSGCGAPPGAGCRGGDTHEHRVRETYARRFRDMAKHLQDRPLAPSLDGYDLVDGLHAAAALLLEEPGPLIHDDAVWPSDVGFPRRVRLGDFVSPDDRSKAE